jgi:tRNA1(Val) A37 N6-methylase TrmN6
MASLFSARHLSRCRLLDPGAGLGGLSAAFIERWNTGELPFDELNVTAFEIDDRLRSQLEATRDDYWTKENLSVRTRAEDFIEAATLSLLGFGKDKLRFTHAILNPPYKKISVTSRHRHLLRKAGIETVNLYSGFLGLVIQLVESGGEIVAIVPRSFCNGPYYKSFRELLLGETSIRHIHLFESRNSAFKDDAVLQENVILCLEKRGEQVEVTISTSTDDTFSDIKSFQAPFASIVPTGDQERFIHIPTSPGQSELELSSSIRYSLADLGIEISTGPVVDFRVRQYLRATPGPGTAPLIYPAHFVGRRTIWPRFDQKKPNALVIGPETKRWLYPAGFYTVVRRFSSKEENRRIVANVISPDDFTCSHLGFENHLNVLHQGKHGLEESLARGLSVFLNSTAFDLHFRRFNGHTQVNATDLRAMKYPSRERLIHLGQWSQGNLIPTQSELDLEIRKIA